MDRFTCKGFYITLDFLFGLSLPGIDGNTTGDFQKGFGLSFLGGKSTDDFRLPLASIISLKKNDKLQQ